MRISISTLSKSFQLSDEALRFYERKGLLQPTRINDRGYRVFDRVDIQRMGNIKRLKNQGFQLDEIRQIYEGISTEDMLALVTQKLAELEREIEYKQLIANRMSECTRLVRLVQSLGETPRLVRIESYYMRLYPSIEDLWEQVESSETLKALFCHLPLSSFTTLIPVGALKAPDKPQGIQKGVLIREKAAHLLELDVSDGFTHLRSGPAVSCVVHLENGQFELDDVAGILLPFLEEHRLAPRSDLFTHQIMNFTDETGAHRHYTELVVPVSPEEG
ncbi:MAG: MerR family transcriptional regulator [Clostridiales bacterium]|jgi:DNA-binding transcriptional MerR regulator|nr:MerR family transcriptional regulator [Bacillota bacterium]NLL54461.1 MerR family transcriptional regulator [Clostridiales bacterium]